MSKNIIAFPTPCPAERKPISRMVSNNVIQMDAWRDRAVVRRTRNGVFFVSNVLCCVGDAA